MNIADLLEPQRVRCRAPLTSKKRALEMLGELLTGTPDEPPNRTVFENLIGRERLGSTGLGKGVALPHARIADLGAPIAALASLAEPVAFEAIDRQPVDLLIALLVPEQSTDEHLRILAGLAEMFSDQTLCEALRRSESAEAMYRLTISWSAGGTQQ